MGVVVVRSRFAKIIRIVSYKRKANVLVILLGYSLGVELDEHGIINAVSLTMKWSQLCNSAFGGAQLYGVCRLQLLPNMMLEDADHPARCRYSFVEEIRGNSLNRIPQLQKL